MRHFRSPFRNHTFRTVFAGVFQIFHHEDVLLGFLEPSILQLFWSLFKNISFFCHITCVYKMSLFPVLLNDVLISLIWIGFASFLESLISEIFYRFLNIIEF